MNAPASESNSRLFRDEAPETADYRSISPLAVIALLLSIVSFGAVFTPMLWVVPIITVLLCIKALHSLALHQDSLSGRGLVLVALTLSCFLGGTVPVHYFTRHRTLNRQARAYAEQWLELIRQGKLMEAHQLRTSITMRAPADANLKEFYESDPNREAFDLFAKTPPISELARWGQAGTIRFVDNLYITSEGDTDIMAQRFDVWREVDGTRYVIGLEIEMSRRTFAGISASGWEVHDCRAVSMPANLP